MEDYFKRRWNGKQRLNLAGQKFGKLTVISIHSVKKRQSFWLCRCDCGKSTVVNHGHLRTGHTQSCSCIHKAVIIARNKSHGMSHYKEYDTWCSMKARCLNRNIVQFDCWGGRGIKVCRRWLHSFQNFYVDMGARPTQKHTLERINNDGNYTPSNCKWATRLEQNNNKRTNKNYGNKTPKNSVPRNRKAYRKKSSNT